MVTYINGKETERNVTEQRVVSHPVTEVISVGTGGSKATEEKDKPVIGDGIITLPTGEVLTYTDVATFRATAYTHTDPGCDMITATGTTVRIGTVAVDPRVIPYGTRMFIVTNDNQYVYGIATAEDCGSAIQGKELDLYMPTLDEAFDYGRNPVTVYFLGEANRTF